jgi:uncharacterized protein with FMN-binding domain
MAKKMSGRLVALSASAVATIYVAGLMSTQPTSQPVANAAAALSPTVDTSTPPTTTATATGSSSAPSVVVGASASGQLATQSASATSSSTSTATPATTSTPAAAATTAATSASTYADGTYAATGTSNLGNVTVSVTTSGGKITNVQIAKVTTKFPVSRIASLPSLVIQNQTASVNVVTGATYSSQAFKQAVQQALTQALAANSTAKAS